MSRSACRDASFTGSHPPTSKCSCVAMLLYEALRQSWGAAPWTGCKLRKQELAVQVARAGVRPLARESPAAVPHWRTIIHRRRTFSRSRSQTRQQAAASNSELAGLTASDHAQPEENAVDVVRRRNACAGRSVLRESRPRFSMVSFPAARLRPQIKRLGAHP
ncbi:hypothetical protein V7S43_007336 [Phytophthora oleae]|uniref:Uncharacterized protein n=1 Tax=Phytophthora oleae TaxID=2107226 RepID=A0ABD3FLK1_9STRA